jgi:hypothetical protein
MRDHETDNEEQQARLAERRERVDAETSSDVHPPRRVQVLVDELDPGVGEHRRRDPLGAAKAQQQPREPVGEDED